MATRRYRPAWWIPGAHLQTLWGKLFRWLPATAARHIRWDTLDGDFLDLWRIEAARGAPRILLLHGLEGGPQSHYARGVLAEAERRGWGADLLVFRSCGGEINRTPRFYHSGETTDLAFVLDRVTAEFPTSPLFLAGVSLGGNVLLKFLGERGRLLPDRVIAAAAVSVPYDLARSSRYIDEGFSRVYQAHFLKSLHRKAALKHTAFPAVVPDPARSAARSLYAFDDAITAPVHGFADADDYYSCSSAIRWLASVRMPTLLLSAVDDPFLPPEVLSEVRAIAATNPALVTEFVDRGGHVGFVSGRFPWRAFYYAEWRIAEFFSETLQGHTDSASSSAVCV